MEFFEILNCLSGEKSYFLENYTEILSIISALYIGLIAFVYIKILDTRREIKESLNFVLLEEYNKENKLKWYLFVNSGLLCLSLFFILLRYFVKNNFVIDIIIFFNLVVAIIDVIYNFFVGKLLEKYIFEKEKILNRKKFDINYNTNLNENKNENFNKKLAFLRSEILNEVNLNNVNIPYVLKMLEEFKKILYESKKFLDEYYINKSCRSNDLNLNYYYQVLYEIQYIFQNIVKNCNKNDLTYYEPDNQLLLF